MSVSLRTRITLYVLALALAAAAFIAIGLATSTKRIFWVAQLQRWEIESADFAAECKAALRDLHFKLLRYELSRAPEDKAEFTKAEEALAKWIEERIREVTVPENRDILREIQSSFARYRSDAHELLGNLPAANEGSARQMLARIETDANQILEIDARLRTAQRESLRALVSRARHDVDWMWRIFYVCMALLLTCGAVLARIVYRDMIAPLRRSVARSRILLERQEKLSALGLLAAGIAHEIRNPLNSIKARLFTQRRVLGEASAGIEDNRFIDGEIDRLETIVEDSLQFARPAAPAFQRMRLRSALESLCELLQPSLAKSGIELRAEFAADPELSIDPNQFRQALLNLANNAADSIGRDGSITLRTRSATLRRGRRRVEAVAVEVQDTGRGIPRDVQQRLFDPFFTTKENGTGLGLSITARIIHAHDGWIECDPSPRRGALFRILLPIDSPHENNPYPPH